MYEFAQVYKLSNGFELVITKVEEVAPNVLAVHTAQETPNKRLMYAILENIE